MVHFTSNLFSEVEWSIFECEMFNIISYFVSLFVFSAFFLNSKIFGGGECKNEIIIQGEIECKGPRSFFPYWKMSLGVGYSDLSGDQFPFH